MNNRKIGDKGESIAVEYLKGKEYRILKRNYQVRSGEIDIIAYDKNILVFAEVKTRNNINYGYAYESVNYNKQRKIIKTSLHYLTKYKIRDIQVRYDIIEVYLKNEGKINHIENAFILE